MRKIFSVFLFCAFLLTQTQAASLITPQQFSALKKFMQNDVVISAAELDTYPYVLAPMMKDHVFIGTGDRVYARGFPPNVCPGLYTIFRLGDPYVDPVTGKRLGYAGIYIGEAKLERVGDPGRLLLLDTPKEVAMGDRLVPKSLAALNLNFHPHPMMHHITGQIVNIIDVHIEGGQYHRVILNRGKKQGLAVGDILGIYRAGDKIKDPYAKEKSQREIALPKEREGSMIVFRTFDNMSVALVLSTTEVVHVGDWLGPYYIPKREMQ